MPKAVRNVPGKTNTLSTSNVEGEFSNVDQSNVVGGKGTTSETMNAQEAGPMGNIAANGSKGQGNTNDSNATSKVMGNGLNGQGNEGGGAQTAPKLSGMNQSPKQNEVRQVISENQLSICAILESHVSQSRLQELCIKVFKGWDWTSNGSFCSSGTRIVLGWNVDVVDLNVVAMTDQVIHTFIRFREDKKELFCSFVYAHNRYTRRRTLWDNLGLHNQLVRNRPWCILGNFNSALNLEDKVEGSSVVDIAMREFKECVDANELVDINRSGLQFTWTQKPHGLDGTLRKIDRIMSNIGFLDAFAGSHAIFQPYRISDHSPAILHIPTISKFKPRPFKFSNILVQNSRFKQQVQECWGTMVSGFHMYKVVSKLKALKKPFRRMLFREGDAEETSRSGEASLILWRRK
ncbi:RNA-directed DNA polymerase, eukaryota, Reverse transcriptase zinc-binding domain protein [Artemisia annua]|uniref:RNA-directed DNA polymerase, eukaryota, Reverse transcriptase zinc-binding domain protein n=1 Tax=Artemisia annua TaxID=35608 RepID=A0A2U1P1W6_ARTAN|nr:RNA-directed DNA polymerase, eukaryota, Reverse transcriptase zinc-binding domain protein [Artemisia annua]